MRKIIVKGVTKKVGEYLEENKVNLSKLVLAEESKIPYYLLYVSVRDKHLERGLRADEFLSICVALNLNPVDFIGKGE